MRIAVGGIHTECSSYSPVLIEAADFTVLRGAGLTDHPYFAFLGQFSADVEPLLHARATPGGPVSRRAYEAFKAEFLARLQAALPVDGLYLAMHGAMMVEGMQDAEGDWIASARDLVGPDVLIATSYDLHGNVSTKVVDQIDIFAAYRTAPHVDTAETMAAAYGMLMRALTTGERPGVVRVPVPLLLPGERSSTVDEPGRSLYAALPQGESKTVWRRDLMIGYVWADEPRATACAVVTGTSIAEVKSAAEDVARSFWAARDDFRFGATTGWLAEMLDLAAAAETAPIILADSGDNPTGGGVGDRADVLAALIERDWQHALIAGIADRPAVDSCFAAGEAARLTLAIGASLDPSGVRVRVPVQVLRLSEGQDASDRQAVVRSGGITLVLSAKRRPYHNIADFTALGLDPTRVALLVVKSGYLSPDLAPLARPNLMALTKGVVDQDIASLSNRHRPKGSLPWAETAAFHPIAIASARFLSRA